jgi:hypothetical protein
MQFDFSLLELFIIVCVGFSGLTIADILINALTKRD